MKKCESKLKHDIVTLSESIIEISKGELIMQICTHLKPVMDREMARKNRVLLEMPSYQLWPATFEMVSALDLPYAYRVPFLRVIEQNQAGSPKAHSVKCELCNQMMLWMDL